MASTGGAPLFKSNIKRMKRDAPPAHFVFKIKSFSELQAIVTKTGDHKYESDEFEASDYKWKFVLYPNGNEQGDGKGHISMCIISTDAKAISSGCHVDVLLSFFIYDHIRDKYLTVQDGEIKRYHVLRTEHGFDQVLSLEKFRDISNGYLVNDYCAFGAEVHVIKNTAKVKEFSVTKNPPHATFTWKIDSFSTLLNMSYCSDIFTVGGYKWKLKLYPKGDSDQVKDKWLSLYLCLAISEGSCRGVYAECKVLIKDQIHGNHKERTFENKWFANQGGSWGLPKFMLLHDVNDPLKGFLVNNSLVVEAKITSVSAVHDLC